MRFRVLPLVLAAVLAFSAEQSPVSGEEMLINPGFEAGVSGWASFQADLQSSGAARSGSLALGVATSGYDPATSVYQERAVNAGWGYHFGAWVVAADSDIQRVFLRITWLGPGNSTISMEDSTWVSAPRSGYQPVTSGLRYAPANAAAARLAIYVMSAGPYTALIDDASFVAGYVPPATPSPTEPPPPPPTATASPRPTTSAPPTAPPSNPGSTPTPGPNPGTQEPDAFDTLVNGSFEQSRSDGTAYGWRNFGGVDKVVSGPMVDGELAIELTSSTDSTKWIQQTVRVHGGAWYAASGWGQSAVGEVFLRLSWYESSDGSGSAIDNHDSSIASPGPSFALMQTGGVQAPAGAHSVKVRLMFRPGPGTSSARFDAVTLGPSSPEAAIDPGEGSSTSNGGSGSRTGSRSGSRAASVTNHVLSAAAEGSGVLPGGSAAGPLFNQPPDPAEDAALPAAAEDQGPVSLPLLLLVLIPLAGIIAILLREVLRRDKGDTG